MLANLTVQTFCIFYRNFVVSLLFRIIPLAIICFPSSNWTSSTSGAFSKLLTIPPTGGGSFPRNAEAVTAYKVHISLTVSARTLKTMPRDPGHAGHHHKTVALSTNGGSISVPTLSLLVLHGLFCKTLLSAIHTDNRLAIKYTSTRQKDTVQQFAVNNDPQEVFCLQTSKSTFSAGEELRKI